MVMVDARQGFLDAVALVLSEHRSLRLVGSAVTVGQALAHGLCDRCDVVAVGLDDTNDMVALGDLCRECPSLGVVVMSSAGGEVHLPVALGWGVRGWVSRQDGVSDLLDALVDVAAGEAHLPAAPLHAMFAATFNDRPDAVLPGARPLTEREAAVLDCLAAGMSRHDIGVALELSDNTVRTYVRRILRKLHVHSASAAVAMTAMSRSETRSEMTNGHTTNGQTTNGHEANGRVVDGATRSGEMAMSEVQVHG